MIFIPLAALAASIVLYRYISSALAKEEFQRFIKEHGCQEPRKMTKSWFEAITSLRRLLNVKASGEDILDDIVGPNFDKARTFSTTVLDGKQTVATIEPANIQAMLATQFKDFATGKRRYQALAPVLGRSIFSSDGPFWEHSRALFRPFFSREHVNDLGSTEKAANMLVEAIESSSIDAAGWTRDVDMLSLFYNLTLDTATDFLFGQSTESQVAAIRKEREDDDPHKSAAVPTTAVHFGSDFETLGEVIQQRIQLNFLYFLGDGFKFRKAISNAHAFTETFVQKAIDAHKFDSPSKKITLLSAVARETQDRTALRNQTLAFLFAGRDTTAALLAWCIIRLTLHPHVLAALRIAILKDFGETRDSSISFAKLKSCRSLQHFINEVLRLNSIVPLNARVAVRNTTMPVGGGPDQQSPVAIRKGTTVLYSVYLMHRRKDLWGDDALEFKPERWEQKLSVPWQFLPFNGGPRICIGQQFALTEASYVLVRLMQRYDVLEAVDFNQMAKMRKGMGLAMWPADGAKVRFHAA